MPRGRSQNKVSHLKPSPKRKPTKHKRVEEIEQFIPALFAPARNAS